MTTAVNLSPLFSKKYPIRCGPHEWWDLKRDVQYGVDRGSACNVCDSEWKYSGRNKIPERDCRCLQQSTGVSTELKQREVACLLFVISRQPVLMGAEGGSGNLTNNELQAACDFFSKLASWRSSGIADRTFHVFRCFP